jgi:hypothetical protein
MLVPLAKMKEAAAIAKTVADKTKPGDPRSAGSSSAGWDGPKGSTRAFTCARRCSPMSPTT